MIKKLFFLLLFWTCIVVNAATYKVLFIGNSYTSVNDLPSLVSAVVGSTGDHLEISSSTPGGCTFQGHLSNSSISLIRQGGWDYVILQAQSQEPSFPEGQFMNETYPYAKQLCEEIRNYSPNASIIFYMTWGRQNGDALNCVYYPPLCTYEGMDSLLRARYMMMAEDNHAVVSPVGALWHYIRDHYPDIQLYQSDESHPTLVGSYAAACSFYTILTHQSPAQITVDCNVPETTASIIRQAAKVVVYDSLSQWLFQVDSTHDAIQDRNVINQISLYPNPVSNFITIDHIDLSEDAILSCYDVQGRLCASIKPIDSKVVMNVSNLEEGIYFIQLEVGNRVITSTKFFKIR
ncbi:MAG: T9SS type A sorting domain-containing protein [Bacteroidales bacterium]|nr:T9SS type A sorting domain-containing protein [Bacteroidales bacterium]